MSFPRKAVAQGRVLRPQFDLLLTTLSKIERQPQPEADPPLAEMGLYPEGHPGQPLRLLTPSAWA